MRLIHDIAKTAATLTQPAGTYSDGLPVMREVACLVCSYGQDATAHAETGTITCQRTFLAAPLDFEPVLPCNLTVGNTVYNIAEVKTYRDIRGRIVAHRFKATGGV